MTGWAPDPHLVGNGAWCSTCFPKGPPVGMVLGATWRRKVRTGCNECAGEGRIAFTAGQIIESTVAEKRERRNAA